MKIYDEDGKQITNIHKPNIGIAIILSLLCPGLGQMYCTRLTRGLLILFSLLISTIIFIGTFLYIIFPIYGIGIILAYFWQLFDAKNIATQMNSDDYKI